MYKITEGLANIEVKENTFYNPKMKGLRDISVLFLRTIKIRNYSVLDATSATGIRAIRYVLEANAKKATLLDINKAASSNAKLNVKKNKIEADVLNKSVQQFCNTFDENFDVVDLDPFGTAAPYIYDLMKVCKDGTVFMATATDTAVLCGAMPNACIKNYGSLPLHNELCHEVGTRIMINYISKIAAQFNFGIEVKLAIANLHYVRVFFILRHGAQNALESVKKNGLGVFCSSCRMFKLLHGVAPKADKRCENCGANLISFGPLWIDRIQDRQIIEKMIKLAPKQTERETVSLLTKIGGEIDVPLFYSIPKITRKLGIGSVSKEKVIKELGKKYAISKTHFDQDGIKTDADIKSVTSAVRGALKR